MPTHNSLGKLLHVDVASDFDVFVHLQMLLIVMQQRSTSSTDGYERTH